MHDHTNVILQLPKGFGKCKANDNANVLAVLRVRVGQDDVRDRIAEVEIMSRFGDPNVGKTKEAQANLKN